VLDYCCVLCADCTILAGVRVEFRGDGSTRVVDAVATAFAEFIGEVGCVNLPAAVGITFGSAVWKNIRVSLR
jgi:hypothetical protein